ncbi:MAG: hypothetical protein QOJ80_672 [Mycobacterium sp.]|jgi:hypothetical protein|nr:hypothetical protein [Mycobacterium sp.]
MGAFVSVYVDMSAHPDDVRSAVSRLPTPDGVVTIDVDDSLLTDTFGCRIAVDLTGAFDEQVEGPELARAYARALSAELGVPAYAFYDLLRRDYPAS